MRTVLVGDGQFQLFRSMDQLTSYVEPPEVEADTYLAYSEDGKRWRFVVKPQEDSAVAARGLKSILATLDGEGENVKREFVRQAKNFAKRCDSLTLPASFEGTFDAIEAELGFT